MAAVPIKEADSDEEAPTDRIAGVKKLLDGRMKKQKKKELELPQVKTEVAQMTKPIQQWNQIKLHEDNIFIIKPNYDASNKQIFAKNEYRSNAEQMFFLLDNMGRSEEGLIFKPKYLGDFS